MNRRLVVAVAILGSLGTVMADSPIAERQALMKANGKAAQAIGGMLKGAPFDLSAAKAAFAVFADAAVKGPALFPDGSKSGEGTEALPAIWENKDDFNARFAKMGEDAAKASAAIVDEASFKANAPALFQNCGGCHEKYRAKKS
jgi:cytochrome c556